MSTFSAEIWTPGLLRSSSCHYPAKVPKAAEVSSRPTSPDNAVSVFTDTSSEVASDHAHSSDLFGHSGGSDVSSSSPSSPIQHHISSSIESFAHLEVSSPDAPISSKNSITTTTTTSNTTITTSTTTNIATSTNNNSTTLIHNNSNATSVHAPTPISPFKGLRRNSSQSKPPLPSSNVALHNEPTVEDLHNYLLPRRNNIMYRIFHPQYDQMVAVATSSLPMPQLSPMSKPMDPCSVQSDDEFHLDTQSMHSNRSTNGNTPPILPNNNKAKFHAGSDSDSEPAHSPRASPSPSSVATPSPVPVTIEQPKLKRSNSHSNIFRDLLRGSSFRNSSPSQQMSSAMANASITGLQEESKSNAAGGMVIPKDMSPPSSPPPHAKESHHSSSSHNMFKDLLLHRGGSKRSPSTSNIPTIKIMSANDVNATSTSGGGVSNDSQQKNGVPLARSLSEASLTQKYGKRCQVLGRGANAVVRLCQKVDGDGSVVSDKVYAVKVKKKKKKKKKKFL